MKSSEYMYTELRKIINDIVIKYQNKGDLYDEHSIEGQRKVDEYILAMEKTDWFLVTRKYKPEAMIRSGLTDDPVLAEIYSKEPASIPKEWQDRVHDAQREIIIGEYVEENEYYRMLSGQPPLELDPLNYAFASEDFYEKYELEFLPVHELDSYYCDILMNDEVEWGALIEMYDAKNVRWYEYLYNIGSKSVDPYRARQALNFQIVHVDTTNSDSKILEDFLNYYEQNREYTMTVLYNVPYSLRYPYYDEYMAFMIIVMTIQRVIVNQFKNGIEREFYDLATLKTLLECYNIPFIDKLPIDRQRMIAKNLNKLLYYKSSDRVIYDISSILGFDRISIHKYLLVKQHRYDNDGNPIFIYKTEINEDGEEVEVFDYEAMYEIYFQSIDLKERDIPMAVRDISRKVDYNWVTDSDPHWWGDDPELVDHLYKDDYNYIETKYLHMNVMYKLTEMLFESTTFIRMLIENESQVSGIEINMSRLSSSSNVSLYDAILSLSTLLCHRHGMKGEFIYGPTKTFAILGFNFSEELEVLKENIKETGIEDYDKINEYIYNMDVKSLNDINRVLGNIDEMREYLTMRTREAKTIQEYRTYRNIYRALLLSKETEELYKLRDDTKATTVKELLNDRRPDIYETIMALDPKEDSEKITELSEHIIYRLQDEIDNLNYLYYVSSDSNTMVDALRKLIMFFKSYTVDLKDFNILYMIDSKFHNRILLMEELYGMDVEIYKDSDDKDMRYMDLLIANIDLKVLDKLEPKERLEILSKIFLIQKVDLEHLISRVNMEAYLNDHETMRYYIDELNSNMAIHVNNDVEFEEHLDMIYKILLYMYVRAIDEIKLIKTDVRYVDDGSIMDLISGVLSESTLNKSLNYEEYHQVKSEIGAEDNIRMIDDFTVLHVLELMEKVHSIDIVNHLELSTRIREKLPLRDILSHGTQNVIHKENMKIMDRVSIGTKVSADKLTILSSDYVNDMNIGITYSRSISTELDLSSVRTDVVYRQLTHLTSSLTTDSLVEAGDDIYVHDVTIGNISMSNTEIINSNEELVGRNILAMKEDKTYSTHDGSITTDVGGEDRVYTSSEVRSSEEIVMSPESMSLDGTIIGRDSDVIKSDNVNSGHDTSIETNIGASDRLYIKDSIGLQNSVELTPTRINTNIDVNKNVIGKLNDSISIITDKRLGGNIASRINSDMRMRDTIRIERY